jgi:hypothetical protein
VHLGRGLDPKNTTAEKLGSLPILFPLKTSLFKVCAPWTVSYHEGACPLTWSVSHFQEKEKRGEMITINDNIK